MAAPQEGSARALALRRGFGSGLVAIALLVVAALPARLAVAARSWGRLELKAERLFCGALIDAAAVVLVLAPPIFLLALGLPLVLRRLAGTRWQGVGALVAAFPAGFALWVLTVVAQEVKQERGAFPTMFDLAEGGGNTSFIEGALGFVRYERVWIPALVGLGLAGLLTAWRWRRTRGELAPWRPWAGGLAGGLGAGSALVLSVTLALSAAANRFTAAALGDPLTGLVESTVDLALSRGPSTPRQLVLDAELPPELAPTGAARIGWPPRSSSPAQPCWPHPYARPLDVAKEPAVKDPRGAKLVAALERASRALFPPGDRKVAVFMVSLEGFRADDVHALNPQASRQVAPFVSGLYEAARAGGKGVLAPAKLFQAGVRTAQGTGAMTCGVGTLPYNLSFIRDLHPFPVRCLPDVLADAGFSGSFFYGSDLSFDGMDVFLKEHHFPLVMGQDDFPKDAPKGTWGGITDFAVFDEAVARVAKGLTVGPQFSLVMSLSHHSPFTPPEDLPAAVTARVADGLQEKPNRADSDDRLRLVAFSYTDAAVERLFERLEREHIADRSIVLLGADHSTGHAYVWGAEGTETDEQKAQIPLAIVIPQEFLARARDRAALDAALTEAQALLDEAPLSQNDVPALLLALLSAHPPLAGLAPEARWHTLGGQLTSPYFEPGGPADSYLLGVNGVSELYALNRAGTRTGGYEDSVFLKTRADRYRVTPRLIPVTAMLIDLLAKPYACQGAGNPRTTPAPANAPPPKSVQSE